MSCKQTVRHLCISLLCGLFHLSQPHFQLVWVFTELKAIEILFMGLFPKSYNIIRLGKNLHLFHAAHTGYTGSWIYGSANSFRVRNSHLNGTYSSFFLSLNIHWLSKPRLAAACFLHWKAARVQGIKNIAKHLKETPYGSFSNVTPQEMLWTYPKTVLTHLKLLPLTKQLY